MDLVEKHVVNHAIFQQFFSVNQDVEKMVYFDIQKHFAVNLAADDRMNYFTVQQYFIVKGNTLFHCC